MSGDVPSRTASTRNLTEFLLRLDRSEIGRLQKRYPGDDERALFESREVMKSLAPLDKARLELALSALDVFIETWSSRAPGIASTLNRASTWKFWGAVLATIGGGSSLGLLLGTGDQAKFAAPTSALALVGGLIGLVAKFLRRDVFGNGDALIDKYRQLAKGASEASKLVRGLRPYATANDDGGEKKAMEVMLAQANKLIADMDELLQSLLPSAKQ